jgi:hypothetical protein
MEKMMTWKLEITIRVAESWVADGFQATPECIEELLEAKLLPYAQSYEKIVTVKTRRAPNAARIAKLQGEELLATTSDYGD